MGDARDMYGTLFNVAMIVAGSLIGSLFKKGIKDKYHTILMHAMGLAAMGLGINAVVQHLPLSEYPVLFIVSLAVGGLIGEKFDLDSRFNHLVSRFSNGNLAEGLSAAILLFCIGTLSILGPIEAALNRNYTYLMTNGMLDGITSIVLASTFGFGIALAAAVLLVWQGSIYLLAGLMENSLSADLMNEVSIVGGLLILAAGLSILEIKKFKTLNLLPALAVPPVAFLVLHLI